MSILLFAGCPRASLPSDLESFVPRVYTCYRVSNIIKIKIKTKTKTRQNFAYLKAGAPTGIQNNSQEDKHLPPLALLLSHIMFFDRLIP